MCTFTEGLSALPDSVTQINWMVLWILRINTLYIMQASYVVSSCMEHQSELSQAFLPYDEIVTAGFEFSLLLGHQPDGYMCED